jgi:tetratricopeptide (TPR) repeat protein
MAMSNQTSSNQSSPAVDPNDLDSLARAGLAALDAGQDRLAAARLARALTLGPPTAVLLRSLGMALARLDRFDDAARCHNEALGLAPDDPATLTALGDLLQQRDRVDDAEACYRAALQIAPQRADTLGNLGAALYRLGRPDEAISCYRAALRLAPDLPELHDNLGRALLLSGQLAEGWAEHEWRWRTRESAREAQRFAGPAWGGEPLGDRILLLHAEQGFGDAIQFCRYAPRVAATARVVLEAPRELVRLFAGLPFIERIVVQGDALPRFDAHCPLLSLPRAFATTLETIPCDIPYLAAAPEHVAAWRARLDGLAGLRVGLAWAGRPTQGADRRRSIALDLLAPLGRVPGIALVSLQTGPASAQTATPPHGMTIHDWTAALRDFADTAALIEALDLVIAVDSAVAHLAGALGKPVWLLNRFDSCWRWLQQRTDSPWYPSLRQFRQCRPGDWASVITDVADALAQRTGGRA